MPTSPARNVEERVWAAQSLFSSEHGVLGSGSIATPRPRVRPLTNPPEHHGHTRAGPRCSSDPMAATMTTGRTDRETTDS